MMTTTWLTVLLFLLYQVTTPCLAVSYMLLRNKAAKCFKLEHLPPGTTLKIAYSAPDLVVESDTPPAEGGDNDLDVRYRERFDSRLEAMKTSRMKDVNINLVQKFENPARAREQKEERKLRIQLEAQEGVGFFRTDQNDASPSHVEVCVQSYLATREDPTRVALNITNSQEAAAVENEGKGKLSAEDIRIIEESHRVAEQHSSGITKELERMEKQVTDLLHEAGESNRVRGDFENRSSKLEKAVRNWPIFRSTVLVIGGFVQVSHVIQYMKRKHIR